MIAEKKGMDNAHVINYRHSIAVDPVRLEQHLPSGTVPESINCPYLFFLLDVQDLPFFRTHELFSYFDGGKVLTEKERKREREKVLMESAVVLFRV